MRGVFVVAKDPDLAARPTGGLFRLRGLLNSVTVRHAAGHSGTRTVQRTGRAPVSYVQLVLVSGSEGLKGYGEGPPWLGKARTGSWLELPLRLRASATMNAPRFPRRVSRCALVYLVLGRI